MCVKNNLKKSFTMPNKAKIHEDCKSTVCLLCMRKGDKYLN